MIWKKCEKGLVHMEGLIAGLLVILIAAVFINTVILYKFLSKKKAETEKLDKLYTLLDRSIYPGILTLNDRTEHMFRDQSDMYTMICRMTGSLNVLDGVAAKTDSKVSELVDVLQDKS